MDSRRKPLDLSGFGETIVPESGIAFGDAERLFKHVQLEPDQQQSLVAGNRRPPLAESGFEGWVDEESKQLREADAE